MQNWVNGFLRLLLALIIMTNVVLRPTGTMLSQEGDTFTYIICTGAETKEIVVAFGSEDGHEENDPLCDFFASQTAAPPIAVQDSVPYLSIVDHFVAITSLQIVALEQFRPPYLPRDPPFLS